MNPAVAADAGAQGQNPVNPAAMALLTAVGQEIAAQIPGNAAAAAAAQGVPGNAAAAAQGPNNAPVMGAATGGRWVSDADLAQYEKATADASILGFEGAAPAGKSYSEFIAKPPRFSGSAGNANAVHDFTHSMLTYLQISQLPPQLYVQVASSYLEGDAITYYRSLVDRRAASVIAWSEFEQGLKLAFGNINQSAHARAQLQNLRQYGSVEAYYKRFMQLCAEISDMPL